MKFRTSLMLLMGSSLSLLLGCATSPTTDAEFGDSVRQMVRSQKVFVAVDETPVDEGDGQRLETVLEGYRERAPATQEATAVPTLVINAGQ